MSAISFWDWETTTAMSVASMKAICSSTPIRSSSGSRPARSRSSARCSAHSSATRSYMRTAVALSIATNIALPRKPAADEVADEVGGDPPQALRAGDQLVLGREAAGQRLLLRIRRARPASRIPVSSSSKLLVDDLQLGDAVLVEERDGGAVLDRVAEVVGRDVVAEDLPRALHLALDQRRAGEAEEAGVGQRAAHVQGEGRVLAAVRLVGDHDHVLALRADRHLARPRSGRNLWIRVKT